MIQNIIPWFEWQDVGFFKGSCSKQKDSDFPCPQMFGMNSIYSCKYPGNFEKSYEQGIDLSISFHVLIS